MRRTIILAGLVLGLAAFGTAFASSASADSIGPITFEPPQGYVVGDINGQMGWTKTQPGLRREGGRQSRPTRPRPRTTSTTQALRLSDAVTSGSFGDQTFSPGLAQPAGEPPLKTALQRDVLDRHALATEQPGLHMSVSPDNGSGARMSYLRFEDHSDGVHVFFDDVTNPGPVGHASNFSDTDIATLSRTRAHSIRFSITFKSGPGNDVVRIYIDGTEATQGHVVGGLLPLRPRADRQRQHHLAGQQAALPRER